MSAWVPQSWRPPVLSDCLLAVLVSASVSWMIYADQAGERTPDLLAYFWAVGLGALMLVRRRYPMVVLWVTVLGLFAYYAAGYPAIGLSVPTAGALLTAAEHLKLRWPIIASVILLAVSYSVRLAQGQDIAQIIGYELIGHLGLMVAAVALGISLRLRGQLQANARRLVVAVEEAERSRIAKAIGDERAEIARELHDALGHQAMVISMHTDLARDCLERGDPEHASSAVTVLKQTSTQMLDELRGTVRALRHDEPQALKRRPPSLSTLAESVAALPLQVNLVIQPLGTLSEPVQAAIHRIVLEALTNVVKHSAAEAAEASIGTQGRGELEEIVVTVTDPGPSRTPRHTRGFGIHGMKERAESLGGQFRAESGAWGFRVHAVLPLKRVR